MADDERFELSRRKALAGLGTIGVASAGAGLGTSAFFNDTESFENNQLTAGKLDLKVDWEEHYYDDSASVGSLRQVSGSDDVGENEVGMPNPDAPMVAVHEDDLGSFMDGTAIEAFPDENNDGIQDDLDGYEACEEFADTPDDLNPKNSIRTDNDDTHDGDDWLPLVNLDDVKPGDFGELTLSFHLCDNPGYVWLQGEQVSASENGHTEPEEEVDGDDDVELLDEIQTLLWYDEDGDNVFEPGGESGGKVDVVLVLDRSGSMGGSRITEAKTAAKNLVDALNLGSDAAQVGVVSFANNESLTHGLSTDGSSVKGAIDGINTGGSTNIEGGVNGGEEELRGSEAGIDFSNQITPSGNDRTDADKVMVVLSDGAPNVSDDAAGDYSQDSGSNPVNEAGRAKSNGIEMYTIGFGISSGSPTAQTLEDMASVPRDSHAYLGGAGELTQIFAQISQQISGEEAFFRGTLGDLLSEVSSGNGIPLDGDRATSYDELDGSDAHEDRDEFVNSTNNFVGLAWWVPRSIGNSIQGDSVSFDLGFYTEQARHNDGSGTA